MIGLFGNLNVTLVLVALFVFLAARSEADAVAAHAPPPVRSPVPETPPSIVLLPAHARANELTRALFAPQGNFPVVQGGEVVGIVSKAALLTPWPRERDRA